MSKEILEFTQEKLVKELGNPYFKILSHKIQVLNSPIDFYLAMCKGIRISYKRIILSSLYIGDGPLERFLMDQIFNKLEVNKNLRLSILVDFHRGHRAKDHTSVNLCYPFKANFQPNDNVRIGFFKNFYKLNVNSLLGLQEIRGVQHMKIAVFDDHVLMTGANLSDSYFTDREDRWVLFEDCPELADYCDDLANSIIDISFQMNDEGKLAYPRSLPKRSYEKKKVAKDRVKLFKFMQEDKEKVFAPFDQSPDIGSKSHEEEFTKSPEGKALKIYNETMDQTDKLKKSLRSEDIFNILKDMPHDLNIVTGNGGWKSDLVNVGSTVYIFPALQFHRFDCNDDLNYIKELIPKFGSLSLASGYMAFPEELLQELEKVKRLSLISASPYANGFLNDGVKNWIPYMYRAYLNTTKLQVKNGSFYEFFKENWTFHAKGLWADDKTGVYFTSIGSSNFSRRSYFRDTEFQLYMWSDCQLFKEKFAAERNRVFRFGYNDPHKFPLKYGLPTKLLARLLRSYL